jgi:adenylate cyclase
MNGGRPDGGKNMSDDEEHEAVDLREILIELGVEPEAIERATGDGTLELLALERVVSLEEIRYDIDEVAHLSGVDADSIRSYWRALGFPEPLSGQAIFNDSDVEMLSAVVSFIAEGTLDPDLAVQMARVIGSAMDKVATAQVDALETRREERQAGETPPLLGAARSTAELLSLMPKVMEFVWRRQLAAAARRRMMRAAASEEGTGVIVGFADLVGFTAKTQQLTEQELAEVVRRFETVAYDVVSAHEGRVVKMIGDEVMFLHHDIGEGAGLALDLAERFRDDPILSDVRVGLACGPVLERDGDVYGNVVNLANRIVSVAYPGSVVVSEQVHRSLTGDTDLVLRSLRSHYLRDIGRVPLWTLRRSEDRSEKPYERARRRIARREFLRERWADVAEKANRVSGTLPGSLDGLVDGDGSDDGSDDGSGDGPTTGQIEALTEAVLDADIDTEMQVTLISDLEIARRLHHLEREAQEKANEADLEAERRMEEIEREVRSRVEDAEREARHRIEEALQDEEEKSRRINEEATRKVQRVAEEAERRAEKAAKEVKADAERKARRRSRKRSRKQD